MRDDYKMNGPTQTLEIQFEQEVVETLDAMCKYTKLTPSEIANTALKGFISKHKDFLPPAPKGKKK